MTFGLLPRSVPSPFVLDTGGLLVAQNIAWQRVAKLAIAFLNSAACARVLNIILFFLDAVRVTIVAGNVVDGTSWLRIAVPFVGDHTRDALGCDFVEPRFFLGGYCDDSELYNVSICPI
jgi:hypothetical protein